MLVQDLLQNSARRRPEKVALVCGEKRLTYEQIDCLADRLAQELCGSGVERGDRVAIHLRNCVGAVIAVFAILKAGAVFVAINRSVKPDKLKTILNDCQAAALIAESRTVANAWSIALAHVKSLRTVIVSGTERTPAPITGVALRNLETILASSSKRRLPQQNIGLDLACLIYTSGTTGEPKGVMCDHDSMLFVTETVAAYLKNTEEDVVLSVLPLAFSYGLYQLLAMFYTGGTLVLEDSFAFPISILAKMNEEHVTGFPGIPTMYSILLGMDLGRVKLPALRYLTNAAAGLPIEHVKRLRRVFPQADLFLMHGLTEVARTMYLPPHEVDRRPGSSGIPIPGTELWLEDDKGRRLGPGEVGELVVRGRHVMRGYWNDPIGTSKRFRPGPLPGETFCYTGDLFKTDSQGFYYFVSRKDDLIKSRGEKIVPREVENALCTIAGVQEAAVIGLPDPVLGQAVKAFVVANDSLTAEALIGHCKECLEEFMIPKYVEFLKELPKTESGKVRKRDLL